MRGRRPLEVVPEDPETERFNVAIRTTVAVLMTTFVGALSVEILGLSAGPLAWFITAGFAVLGCFPLVVHASRSRRVERLPVGRLPETSASRVAEATQHARRLHELAETSPPGPVADDLRRLADTADGYVVALHGSLSAHPPTANGAEPGSGLGRRLVTGGPLDAEADRLVVRLAEVVEAAEGLRRAQRIYLEQSSLDELTDRIQHVTEAIESNHDGNSGPSW